MAALRFASWFSGIGCFDRAFEQAGWECASSCEIDPFARKVYEARFKRPVTFEDITRVEAKDIPQSDCWVGGFPCQDCSSAGKRAGINAARSGLLWTLLDLWDRSPAVEWLVLENVPGLISGRNPDSEPDEGDVGGPAVDLAWMGIVLGALADRGLRYAWRVLDARFFGVPQRRRRVFFVARRARDGDGPREVLFEPEGVRGDLATGGEKRTGVAGRTESGACGAINASTGGPDDNDAQGGRLIVANTLSATAGHHGHSSPRGDGSDNLVTFQNDADMFTHTEETGPLRGGHAAGTPNVAFFDAYSTRGSCSPNQNPCKTDGLSDTLDTTGPGAVAIPFDLAQITSNVNRARCAPGYEAPTLAAQGQPHVATPMMVRRLTATECELLQGLPPGWTCLCGCAPYRTNSCRCTDSPRYRALGNGGAVPVMRWIAERLKEVACARA